MFVPCSLHTSALRFFILVFYSVLLPKIFCFSCFYCIILNSWKKNLLLFEYSFRFSREKLVFYLFAFYVHFHPLYLQTPENNFLARFSAFCFFLQVIVVELNHGWNSRLGFSLKPDPSTQQTIISAIHSDSVAAKDGRLKVGDQIVMVRMNM